MTILIALALFSGPDVPARPAVVLRGDSLAFLDPDRPSEVWIMADSASPAPDGGQITFARRAKVSADSHYALVFEETRFLPRDSFFTRVTLYKASRKKIRTETFDQNRRIAFDLTDLIADTILLGTVNPDYTRPRLELIPPRGSRRLVLPDTFFSRIIRLAFSPNRRRIVLHARKPSGTRIIDVIYARDLETGRDWEYLFPVCLTCRRTTIDISIADDGRAEVVYKNEHRIFSPTGELTDIFIKAD